MAEIERETFAMKPEGSFTSTEYAEKRGITRERALPMLERMVRMGRIKKISAGNRVYWIPL